MMRLIVLLLAVQIAAGCTKDAAHEDAEYLETILEGLRLEGERDETVAFFKKHGHELRIFSNCEKGMVESSAPCENGYRSTGIIKLPSNDPELGPGIAQVYLRLDSNGLLEDRYYDLYYEKLDDAQ